MTKEPVLHSFAYCLDFLRGQVAGVADADLFAQPNGIMNHPAWTQVPVGHTANHVGQVSVWRGAMGLPPLGRSFE